MAYDVPFPEVERDLPICLEIRGLQPGFWACFWAEDFRQELQKWDDGSNLRRFFKFSWKMSPLLAKFTQAHRISMDSFQVPVEVPNLLLVHRV